MPNSNFTYILHALIHSVTCYLPLEAMIENTLLEKKRSPKGPLFAFSGAVVALGLGFFLYFSSKNTDNTDTLADNKTISAQHTASESISYPNYLTSLFKDSLIYPSVNSSPLVIIKPKVEHSQAIASIDLNGPLIILPSHNKIITLTVSKGDSLSILFNKAGLPASVLHNALESSAEAKKYLTQLDIGQAVEFTLNESGDLLSIVTKPNLLNTYTLVKHEDGYRFKHDAIKPSYKEVHAYGVINSSLFTAADKAGVPHSMIIEIANAFGYDIDFALDLRQGDVFEAIFEQKLVKGKVVGTGNLLAARFVNRGKEYTAIRYINKQGSVAYYRADGTSMRRAFIRTPVDFTRISSKFTLGRYHPILNKIRAHKGVDYAAPAGTAIRAAGDGRIVERGVKGGYGNAIVLQHGKTYSTLYGHMSRFVPGLKVGSHVKQGQTIGYVGMTGLATGPHLHYEFRVNGQHVDPLSIKLPMADPLPQAEKVRFLALSKPLMAKMTQGKNTMVAAKEPAATIKE